MELTSRIYTKKSLCEYKMNENYRDWGGGGLGSGEVWGGSSLGGMLFGEVCHLGRYVVWGGLRNAALVFTLILASCKN